MKHIELKTLGPDPVFNYRDVLGDVCRRPLNPQSGVNIAEMRQSLRVLDAIDSANGTLNLEDADYQHLKDKLEAMPWNVVDRRIVQLIDDVSGA